MKYILSTGIFLTFVILFTASSGILKAEAYSDYETDRKYSQDNHYKYSQKSLYGLDQEFLEGIDKKALLNTTINLLKELQSIGTVDDIEFGTLLSQLIVFLILLYLITHF